MGADPEHVLSHVLCNSKPWFLFAPLFILHFSSCNDPKTEEQSELPNLLPSQPSPARTKPAKGDEKMEAKMRMFWSDATHMGKGTGHTGVTTDVRRKPFRRVPAPAVVWSQEFAGWSVG